MKNQSGLFFGAFMIVLGGLFMLVNFGYIDSIGEIFDFWPLLLVVLGVRLLMKRSRGSDEEEPAGPSGPAMKDAKFTDIPNTASAAGAFPGATPSSSSNADWYIRNEVFGDLKERLSSKSFKGGNASVVFGEIVLDLTDVQLNSGTYTLNVSTVFGSIKLMLPENLAFSFHASAVGGEISLRGDRRSGMFQNLTYKSIDFDGAERRLIIESSVIFGEIKVQ